MPARQFGSVLVCIPAPLGIGKLELADSSVVTGLSAKDITEFGGWRGWLASK